MSATRPARGGRCARGPLGMGGGDVSEGYPLASREVWTGHPGNLGGRAAAAASGRGGRGVGCVSLLFSGSNSFISKCLPVFTGRKNSRARSRKRPIPWWQSGLFCEGRSRLVNEDPAEPHCGFRSPDQDSTARRKNRQWGVGGKPQIGKAIEGKEMGKGLTAWAAGGKTPCRPRLQFQPARGHWSEKFGPSPPGGAMVCRSGSESCR